MTTIRIHEASTLLSRITNVEIRAWKQKRELIKDAATADDDDNNNNNNKVYLYPELHNTITVKESAHSLPCARNNDPTPFWVQLKYLLDRQLPSTSSQTTTTTTTCMSTHKQVYMNNTEVYEEAQQVSTTYSLFSQSLKLNETGNRSDCSVIAAKGESMWHWIIAVWIVSSGLKVEAEALRGGACPGREKVERIDGSFSSVCGEGWVGCR